MGFLPVILMGDNSCTVDRDNFVPLLGENSVSMPLEWWKNTSSLPSNSWISAVRKECNTFQEE